MHRVNIGASLKDYKTQEQYHVFIQDKVNRTNVVSLFRLFCFSKLNNFWRIHYSRIAETDKEATSRKDNQENILILFRASLPHCPMIFTNFMLLGKLRGGLVSSERRDQFAVEGELV